MQLCPGRSQTSQTTSAQTLLMPFCEAVIVDTNSIKIRLEKLNLFSSLCILISWIRGQNLKPCFQYLECGIGATPGLGKRGDMENRGKTESKACSRPGAKDLELNKVNFWTRHCSDDPYLARSKSLKDSKSHCISWEGEDKQKYISTC